jgi:hypothetical protein
MTYHERYSDGEREVGPALKDGSEVELTSGSKAGERTSRYAKVLGDQLEITQHIAGYPGTQVGWPKTEVIKPHSIAAKPLRIATPEGARPKVLIWKPPTQG